jgi:hypothetical protein
MSAFVLALKHSGSFVVVNGIGALITFLGKITISVGNTVIAYIMLTQMSPYSETVHEPLAPAIFVFFISYIMASIFM